MDLYLRRGKYGCAAGAKPPPADARITIDVTTQVMVAHVTPTIGDTTQHKVAPQGCHVPTSPPMREISSRDKTLHNLHPKHPTRAQDEGRARQAYHMSTTNNIPHCMDNIAATHDGAETSHAQLQRCL